MGGNQNGTVKKMTQTVKPESTINGKLTEVIRDRLIRLRSLDREPKSPT